MTRPLHTDLAQQWMLAALPGAFSEPHIDGGGYCTWVKMVAGSKVWWISQGLRDPVETGSFELEGPPWLEVVLSEGDEL